VTDIALIATIVGSVCTLLVLCFLVLTRRKVERRNSYSGGLESSGGSMVFLIRNSRLIDASFAAHKYLQSFQPSGAGHISRHVNAGHI